jgi:phosphorylase, glycogen/starch/alpha-glucan family
MEKKLNQILENKYSKTLEKASTKEVYYALLELTKDMMSSLKKNEGKKKLYYISAEFLIGKLLSNNLINLGIFDEVQELLEKNGHKLSEVEEFEPEPSLGNGGLGRLAACFLDSIANLGLNGDGIGLNYHEGLFLQKFEDNKQKELRNSWIEKESWLEETNIGFEVPFKDFSLKSKMYDISVPGYEKACNKLHLFDLVGVDESIIKEGISFDKTDIKSCLTLFLYPDDSDEAGYLLRIYQQYFMVSNAAQLIIKETLDRGGDLKKLNEYVSIQINDTHPTMVIPELIRILTKDYGFDFDTACDLVSKTCAYTNHTILAEALEKWPLKYLEKVVPALVPIIEKLDKKVRKLFKNEKLYIIDKDKRVHMAHIDIHFGYSVNGVAALHTDILKESELKDFYEVYPEKFNNKTNGITFRRWLVHCNHRLSAYLNELIGKDYLRDASKLEKLLEYKDNEAVIKKLEEIKKDAKLELKDFLKSTQNLDIDENSIFDIQIKRLHEYKRQQMNVLYAIYKYKEIKKGKLPKTPITMIFGAKAAPAYTIAKDIIHLILCLQELFENDEQVRPYLRIVMVENYNVSKASKLIPACDISEQISLASKEASGTGNMKFMLNGAVTLGTEDGANVEIHELVGDDNIYVFGKKSDEIIELYKEGSYSPAKLIKEDKLIKEITDFIIDKELIKIGDKVNLERLYKDMTTKDWFMALLDVKDYIETKEKAFEDFENKKEWGRKMLVNIAKAGYFSSDRTIAQYNEDIWKLN